MWIFFSALIYLVSCVLLVFVWVYLSLVWGGLFYDLVEDLDYIIKLGFLTLVWTNHWKVWLFIGALLFPLHFFPVYTGCGTWAIFESLRRMCIERSIRYIHKVKFWKRWKGSDWMERLNVALISFFFDCLIDKRL